MRKRTLAAVLSAAVLAGVMTGCGGGSGTDTTTAAPADGGSAQKTEAAPAGEDDWEDAGAQGERRAFPAGTITMYGTGQPQYLLEYFNAWLERNQDIAAGITLEMVQTEGTAQSRERITMTALAGADDDLPDAVYLDPVNIMDLSQAGLLRDETEYLQPYLSEFVDGAANDATINGKIYGLPDAVRPNVLFYNEEIFKKYDVDPAMMDTFEGYIEAGRQLKEKSDGSVYLSYVSPSSKTWRYWGRRGLMPQANAKIWDDGGNVVIGEDPGTKLALTALDTMMQEGLLLKSEIMEPALYDAINNQQVATFYIGAFWDEFLRKNCQAVSGQWRVMASPVFEEVGTTGAPVSTYFCIVNKGDNTYAELLEMMWHDFHFDIESRNAWVAKMEADNAPYSNPITKSMLEDEFWKEPSEYYGGMSFREMEGKCLSNGSKNLIVTPQDAQADEIISAELETYIAGNQSIEDAIANMDKNLKAKIGQAEIIQ